MQSYLFREEERPKFNLTFSSFLALLLVLLLFLGVKERNPFQLQAAELQRLKDLKEQQQREMVFRFSDAPDEDLEDHDAKFLSDADRRLRSLEQNTPSEDPDPYSKGDTYELENAQTPPGAQPQAPSPRVVQPEIKPSPEVTPNQPQKPMERQAETPPAKNEPKEAEPTDEPPPEAVADEPEEVTDEAPAETVREAVDTSAHGTLPVVPGAPRPYRPASEAQLAEARRDAVKEMNLRDAARVDAGSRAQASFDNPTGTGSPFLGLTVETTRSDMGEYLKVLRQLIRGNWRIPNIARYEVSGVTGIGFNIQKNGQITDVYLIQASGHEPLDVSAKNAITNTDPAPPLPSHVDEPFVPIKFGFYYNMRPRY